jgi:hypothetical protein
MCETHTTTIQPTSQRAALVEENRSEYETW